MIQQYFFEKLGFSDDVIGGTGFDFECWYGNPRLGEGWGVGRTPVYKFDTSGSGTGDGELRENDN